MNLEQYKKDLQRSELAFMKGKEKLEIMSKQVIGLEFHVQWLKKQIQVEEFNLSKTILPSVKNETKKEIVIKKLNTPKELIE